MPKAVRISLAHKCQLLFGAAVVLILSVALIVVWMRMETLVREGQEEAARKLTNAWLADRIQLGGALTGLDDGLINEPDDDQGLSFTLIDNDEFEPAAARDPFVDQAVRRFQERPDLDELFTPSRDRQGERYYRYARAIRKSDLLRIRGGAAAGFSSQLDVPDLFDPLEMVLVVGLRGELVRRQLTLNSIYLVAAGLLAGLLAIGVFWFITTYLILSPVRLLRETASKVAEGELNTRADINTGDEFEQLSDVFNQMLDNLKENQDKLRSTNKGLDLKLGELAQHNVALYEANKVKGEFLANVSHELRTPLNSIIGFAEVLQETLKDRTGPVDEKRKRYASNIIISSRHLLELINDLLDLAKIEAGRMDVRPAPVSISDLIEGLSNLMSPQASKRQIELVTQAQSGIPLVQTDAPKLQQILFNFLSNAIKFTPEGGRVTLAAELLEPDIGGKQPRVRLSVSDTGPGIPPEMHEKIFEKFTQLDQTVTRAHGGTGLGLTISQELASLLHGQIQIQSDTDRGATFSVTLPVHFSPKGAALMPEKN